MITKKIFFGLLAALSASQVQAQYEGRWYNVELLIFKRISAETFTDENWRRGIELAYPENSVYLGYSETTGVSKVRGEDDTEAYIDLNLLAEKNYQLKAHRYALTKNKNFKVLFHQAWSQQMQGRQNSPAIVVSGGETIADHKELSGYIRIHIGRYLHLTSDLWLITGSDPAETPSTQVNNTTIAADVHSTDIERSWPKIPQPPQKLPEDVSDSQNQLEVLQKTDVLTDWQTSRFTGYNSLPVTTLRGQRRMRSNELHYLDHPLMGLLILIQPVEET